MSWLKKYLIGRDGHVIFMASFSAVKRWTFNAPTFRSEVLLSNVSRKCDYAERTLRIDVRF